MDHLSNELLNNCYLFQTNRFIQSWSPWNMVKDPSEKPAVETVLLVAMESLRLSACLLYPVLPKHCSSLLHRLGFPAPPTKEDLRCKFTSEEGLKSLEKNSVNLQIHKDISKPLFKKVALTTS